MPQRRSRRGKIGDDGLTDRERAFAVELRKDPTASYATIAGRAGFLGSDVVRQVRGRNLMQKEAVRAIVNAPERPEEFEINEETLKDELRKRLLLIVRGQADAADKIRAIDKLLCTIPGGYVPVQVDMKNTLNMEKIVRAMGGAPEEPAALPEPLPTQEGADA